MKKRILTVIAFVLSIALLVGGIASAAILSNDSNDIKKKSTEIVAGTIKPRELADGGFGISNGKFSLQVYAVDKEFGVQVVNEEGNVAAEEAYPIHIQIKRQSATDDWLGTNVETESISENYNEVKVKDSTIIATATVSSQAGSVFAVEDQYIGCDGGFELIRDIQVLFAAEEDEGFNSIVSFKEKEEQTYDAYEYFIPSTVMRDSSHLIPSAIGSDLSMDFVWVRESHMGLPLVMARNKRSGFTFAMGRIIDEEITSGVDESQGTWVVNKNLDYGSSGISNVNGYTSIDVCYPGMEGDINYLDGSIPFVRRSHPVRDDVVHTYKVLFQVGNTSEYTDAVVSAYQTQFLANQIPKVDADLDKVYDVTLDLFSDFTQEYAYGKTGMPFALDLEGDATALDSCIGFIGQQTTVGYHLIRKGIATDSEVERKKGEDVIDTWVRDGFTEYGFPRVWFVTSGYEWAKTTFITSYVRYMSDGMEGILNAYMEEKEAGIRKPKWLERCVEYADWLVKVQNADGSYYRAYNPDTGKVSAGEDGKIGNDKNNTACNIRFLVRMYEQTGQQKYLNAAIAAGEYVYENNYLQDTYYGGTPDGQNVVDKEACVMALYAFDSLYEATGQGKWLPAAEHAAICAASFVYTFDFTVWGAETYNIYRDLVGTSGLSRISTGSSGVDSFSAYLYYEYFKLYVYTGNEFYYNLAELFQNNTKQFINIDGSLPYALDGLVDEAQTISNMFYASDVQACLAWCNVAMIDPIGSMEDTFGVKTIAEAVELGQDTLLMKLGNYGAGGNHR